MRTHRPSRGIGQLLIGLVILAITAYVAARLLLWLFPSELHMVAGWLRAKL